MTKVLPIDAITGSVTRFLPDWQAGLIVNGRNDPRPILANVLIALRLAPEFAGRIMYDEFGLRTVVASALPWDKPTARFPREWTTHDDLSTTEWCQHRSIHVDVKIVQQAVELVSAERTVHPIRTYLNSLKWDGTPRVDRWLTTYGGAEPTPYVSAVGQRFLIAAVARIMQPGAKADTMLLLQGRQGIGKSTLLQILGGEWFGDEMPDVGTKDAALMARSAWLIEFAELDAILNSRGGVSAIKAFMSRQVDRYRPPYGRRIVEVPRQSIFAGSTNDDVFFKDSTGNRRFWPVRLHTIDIEGFRKVRDQIWAEAVHLYRQKAPWWLDTEELELAAMAEQAERYIGDPWDSTVSSILAETDDTSVAELLTELGIEISKRTQRDENRVVAILKCHGFVRYRRRVNGSPVWRYRRATA